VRIHYNSSKLTFNGLSNAFSFGRKFNASLITPANDESDLDSDPLTDKYIALLWADDVDGLWPGSSSTLPLRLITVNFIVDSGLQAGDTSVISFTSASTASGYIFLGNPSTFKVLTYNLDVDGNGAADALTDGLMVLRYLGEITGAALTDRALGGGATRTTATDIETYLAGAKQAILDVDGNGAADALTDGLMVLRYLGEITGAALTDRAVGSGATRSTAADIETYLMQLKP
jgi:hypothetical protein